MDFSEPRLLSGNDKRPESQGFNKLSEFCNSSLRGYESSQNTCFTVFRCNQGGVDDPWPISADFLNPRFSGLLSLPGFAMHLVCKLLIHQKSSSEVPERGVLGKKIAWAWVGQGEKGKKDAQLSGTGDSQRNSHESIRVNHSQLKPPIFIARQADSPESLECPIRANHATKTRKRKVGF